MNPMYLVDKKINELETELAELREQKRKIMEENKQIAQDWGEE